MPRDSPNDPDALELRLVVDGSGAVLGDSGVSVLDDLLRVAARAGRFDLELSGSRPSHAEASVHAVAVALGRATATALSGASRTKVGSGIAPAEEALAQLVIEAAGNPLLVANVDLSGARVAGLRSDFLSRFLHGLAEGGGLTIHARLLHGEDTQHVLEAIFKALGIALAALWAATRA